MSNDNLNFDLNLNEMLNEIGDESAKTNTLQTISLPHKVNLGLMKVATPVVRFFFHITGAGIVKQGVMHQMVLPFNESKNNANKKVFVCSMIHPLTGLKDFSFDNPWKDPNVSNFNRIFKKGSPFNSAVITGTLTQQLIPANDTIWSNTKHNEVFTKVYETLKNIANSQTIVIGGKRSPIPRNDTEAKALVDWKKSQTEALLTKWATYEKDAVDKGLLIKSDVIFAEAGGVMPTFMIHQQMNLQTNDLSYEKLFQDPSNPMTYAPVINEFNGYAKGNVNQQEDLHTRGQEDSQYKAVPLGMQALDSGINRCHVAAHCFDRVRGTVPIRLSMMDTNRDNTNSRSRAFLQTLSNNPHIQVNGKVRVLSAKHGTLASLFVIEANNYVVLDSRNTDLDSGNLSIDEDLMSVESDLAPVSVEFAEQANHEPEAETDLGVEVPESVIEDEDIPF